MIQDLFFLFFFSLDVITWLAWQRLDEAKILWFAATLEWANYIEILIGSFWTMPSDRLWQSVRRLTYVRTSHARTRKEDSRILFKKIIVSSFMIDSFIHSFCLGRCMRRASLFWIAGIVSILEFILGLIWQLYSILS